MVGEGQLGGFEFVFSIFGLMLGFSLVEVVAGFGRAVDAKVRAPTGVDGRRTRIGWLSPLLGLFVIFNLVSFWTAGWAVRDAIPVRYTALLFGLAVTASYYFAAMLVFPREVHDWPNLDDHYFRVKRWVAGVVAGCNAVGSAGLALAGARPFSGVVETALNLGFYVLLAALFLAPGRRANLVLLVILVATYPLTSLLAYLI